MTWHECVLNTALDLELILVDKLRRQNAATHASVHFVGFDELAELDKQVAAAKTEVENLKKEEYAYIKYLQKVKQVESKSFKPQYPRTEVHCIGLERFATCH